LEGLWIKLRKARTVSEPTELKTVTITILNRNYQINCPVEAEPALHQSAEYLNQRMTEMQSKTRLINAEHLAVMAALNITHELFAQRKGEETYALEISEKIERLSDKLDKTLSNSKKTQGQPCGVNGST
jgi:cell division protein ZapA